MSMNLWVEGCVMNAVAGHFLRTWLLLTHPKMSVREFKLLSMRGHPVSEEFRTAVKKAIVDTTAFGDYDAMRKVTG